MHDKVHNLISPEYLLQSETRTKRGRPFQVVVRYREKNKGRGENILLSSASHDGMKSCSFPSDMDGFSQAMRMANNPKYSDVYISQALFLCGRGLGKYIGAFTHIWCDLDCYEMSNQDALQYIMDLCMSESIPLPSTYTFSGRGVYLKWLFNQPLFRNRSGSSIRLVRALLTGVAKKFKEVSADFKATDPTRILRMPGSFNPKSRTRCEVFHDSGLRYDISELRQHFLTYSSAEVAAYYEAKKKKKKSKKTGATKNYNNWALRSERIISDLRTLVRLRWKSGHVAKGYRDIFGHIAIAAVMMTRPSGDDLLSKTAAQISDFMPSDYMRKYFESHSSSAVAMMKKGEIYRYKTATIIDKLGITPQEQQHMSTLADVAILASRRKSESLKKRKDSGVVGYIEKRETLNHLYGEGVKPWEFLKISRATYYRNKEKYDTERRAAITPAVPSEAPSKPKTIPVSMRSLSERFKSDVELISSHIAFKGYVPGESSDILSRLNRKRHMKEEMIERGMTLFYQTYKISELDKMRKRLSQNRTLARMKIAAQKKARREREIAHITDACLAEKGRQASQHKLDDIEYAVMDIVA